MNDLLKAMNEDVNLRNEAMNLWKEGASAKKIAEFLSKKGIRVGEQRVEELFSEIQKSKAKELTSMELDDDELEKVSGGGTGNSCFSTDDCDRDFKNGCSGDWAHPNGENMFDSCDWYYGCSVFHYCDQFAAIG